MDRMIQWRKRFKTPTQDHAWSISEMNQLIMIKSYTLTIWETLEMVVPGWAFPSSALGGTTHTQLHSRWGRGEQSRRVVLPPITSTVSDSSLCIPPELVCPGMNEEAASLIKTHTWGLTSTLGLNSSRDNIQHSGLDWTALQFGLTKGTSKTSSH